MGKRTSPPLPAAAATGRYSLSLSAKRGVRRQASPPGKSSSIRILTWGMLSLSQTNACFSSHGLQTDVVAFEIGILRNTPPATTPHPSGYTTYLAGFQP